MADGVGGWNKKGVYPALFSNELCGHFKRIYDEKRDRNEASSQINLKELLVESVQQTKSIGTSTFVAAKIEENEPFLHGLNLGDSGYMLIRP